MLYNTEFQVKYNDIYKELKQNNPQQEDYTFEEIDVICNKLYMDEIASVFFADHILDDKIDVGMRKTLSIMKQNEEFGHLLEELRLELLPQNTYDYDKAMDDENEYLLLIAFFSYPIFHLMHKIVCLQLQDTNIPDDLLKQLKELTTKLLTNEL